ncbi:hypothetical protein, partial [Hungatella effluvii]
KYFRSFAKELFCFKTVWIFNENVKKSGTGSGILKLRRKGDLTMITIFNRKELYSGFSMVECSRIGRILKKNKIPYIIKECDLNPIRPGFISTSAPMIQTKPIREYYLYVDKKDYEEASFLLTCEEGCV